MSKIGFNQKWIDWKKLCLETGNYSILINGDSIGKFSLGRGLRHGDPLLPHLFIICNKGLSSLLKKVKIERVSLMILRCGEGLQISHFVC